MSEISLQSITEQVKDLVPLKKTKLSDYLISAVASGERSYNIQALLEYLDACNHNIVVEDLMGDKTTVRNFEDIDNLITVLCSKYNRTLGRMRNDNNVNYGKASREEQTLSVTNLIKILNYFKCDLVIK